MLIPVDDIVAEIKGLKSDPSQILVAAIAGPPDPYSVIMVDAEARTQDAMNSIKWPNVAHSCTMGTDVYGDPGVRLQRFVNGFGSNGLFLPICAPTLAPALQMIARVIIRALGPQCVVGQLLDANGQPTDGPGAQCSVIDHQFDQSLTTIDTIIPPCDNNPSGGKCWSLVNDPQCAAAAGVPSHLLQFTPPPDPTVSGLNASISCSTQVN